MVLIVKIKKAKVVRLDHPFTLKISKELSAFCEKKQTAAEKSFFGIPSLQVGGNYVKISSITNYAM